MSDIAARASDLLLKARIDRTPLAVTRPWNSRP